MILSNPLIVVLIAALVWWFSTGLVLYAVRRSEGETEPSLAATLWMVSVFAVLGLVMMAYSRNMETPSGAYLGFFGALLVWAWHEATFLTGLLTGPRKEECPDQLSTFGRFKAAWEAICNHEMAILFTALGLYWMMFEAANMVGFWTFMLLWVMRISAKMNIFLGARNSMSELMPKRISYLKSYFNTSRTSVLFPVSVTLAMAVFISLCFGAYQANTPFLLVSHVLLATFMALAIFEHFILVLPISDSALWAWAVPPSKDKPDQSDARGASLPDNRIKTNALSDSLKSGKSMVKAAGFKSS